MNEFDETGQFTSPGGATADTGGSNGVSAVNKAAGQGDGKTCSAR